MTLTPASGFGVITGFAGEEVVAFAGSLSGMADLALSDSPAELRVISLNDSTRCFTSSSKTSKSATDRSVTERLRLSLTTTSSRTSTIWTASFSSCRFDGAGFCAVSGWYEDSIRVNARSRLTCDFISFFRRLQAVSANNQATDRPKSVQLLVVPI